MEKNLLVVYHKFYIDNHLFSTLKGVYYFYAFIMPSS